MLGGAVDDDVEILAPARRHQVVDDPAFLVEQQRIFGLHVGGGLEVAGHQLLERRIDAAAVHQQLAHVADVEQPGILARPQVLGDDPFVLDRHFVAGERHHPRTALAVPGVERKLVELRRRSAPAASGSPLYGRAPRLGFVGWTVVDFPAHSMRSGKGCDCQRSPRSHPAAAPVCP